MPDLNRILSAKTPLTLASVARGAAPLVMADLARAAAHSAGGKRAVWIAPDEAGMRSVAEAAVFFAPELETIEYPAWDCLPYDRASPALSVSARRPLLACDAARARSAMTSGAAPRATEASVSGVLAERMRLRSGIVREGAP